MGVGGRWELYSLYSVPLPDYRVDPALGGIKSSYSTEETGATGACLSFPEPNMAGSSVLPPEILHLVFENVSWHLAPAGVLYVPNTPSSRSTRTSTRSVLCPATSMARLSASSTAGSSYHLSYAIRKKPSQPLSTRFLARRSSGALLLGGRRPRVARW